MPTSLATIDRPAPRDGAAPSAAPGCAACPHPVAGHDPVARRFCQATVSSALERGCVCRLG